MKNMAIWLLSRAIRGFPYWCKQGDIEAGKKRKRLGLVRGLLSVLMPIMAFVCMLSSGGAAYAQGCHWRQNGVTGPGWYRSDGNPCGAESSVPQERWDSRWGAIALSPSTGGMGAAAKRTKKKYAEKVALKECKAKSGASDCEVRAVYGNACVAYARWNDSFAINGAPSVEEASLSALDTCNEAGGGGMCQIVYAECSPPERIW